MKVLISLAIMVYFVLLIILILNMEEKSKIIKYSFLMFVISLFTALFFVNELVMDYFISAFIKYFYYPTFSSILLTVIVAMLVLIYNVFNDRINAKKRIVNYVFASFVFIGYIIFAIQNVNINSYNALYMGNSLMCLRYISRTFILWIIITLAIKYFSFFLRKR